MKLATSLVACIAALAPCQVLATRNWLSGNCPRSLSGLDQLGRHLSRSAKIYFPGSEEFAKASQRWSVLESPKVDVVVVPGTEKDVAEAVKFANKAKLPFLAFNTAHGAITTLGKMDHGVEIYLEQLSSVEIAKNGRTAKIGGGTMSKVVTDSLWEKGKQTVTGTCECVSFLGPALGGGHGWLQGHHGLIADQLVSVNIVLADGSQKTIDQRSDLWWAIRGAGHNFGIVTSATVKIYDVEHANWAVETLIFSGDKVEEVYQAVNGHLTKDGNQSVDVINWSYWLNNPDIDAEKPVILFWIIQEGVSVVDPLYTKPFYDIGPLVAEPTSGTYLDLAEWTGISLSSAPCQKSGLSNPRFPLYVRSYNVTAQKQAYDLFASAVTADSPFYHSLYLFEGYSMQAVRAVDERSTAFAFRDDNLLTAPLITYTPGDSELDTAAARLGNQLRDILHAGSGQDEMRVYVNYAYGNESPEQWYGSERWRQSRLRELKRKYDPKGRFSFYAPVA
ncbi:hypothetical protein jhhlp_007733 [Lomentospora prolificans]|uniref:FAD-binding PCMH-type domain-containing protein n=1 Tax=Lomentospora prolificans TaxID=41688 RepID=A0A2N3N0G6_9PEZI|nr:hypothetical protein jhhlp_007733 [Lomentospora prolificans]